MWCELITELHQGVEPIHGLDPGPEFFPGATPEALAEVERQVGVALPASLRELLSETDGVLVVLGQHMIWATHEIVQRNLEMRAPDFQVGWMPLDHLLSFGDAGVDGIAFAFGVVQGVVRHELVYSWNPTPTGDQGRQSRSRHMWKAG